MAEATFIRPSFTPFPPKIAESAKDDVITSIGELILFNAIYNPNHIFCIQAQPKTHDVQPQHRVPNDGIRTTFAELHLAVTECSSWLCKANLQRTTQANSNGASSIVSPVALYLESDIGLFVHLAALQSLNIPVLLLSIRLSPASVQQLLKTTGSQAILVSKRTRESLGDDIGVEGVQKTTVEPYTIFIPGNKPLSKLEAAVGQDAWPPSRNVGNQVQRNLILHSSGTTGVPKPIYLTNRYLLQYASCHQFSPEEKTNWTNLSTLPLYHGFGFLAPCLSLSLGMTCVFPPSSLIPAGRSTLDLLQMFHCQSLMTVPSIVGEMLAYDDAVEKLSHLNFLAVGGGALSPDQGLQLKSHNINLLNHYGVTEIGAIAPIFRPDKTYDWRFLRLRQDIGLQLRLISGSSHFKLVGSPLAWDSKFEVQDELEINPNAKGGHTEIRILGRIDDLIVLKTGEKVMPQLLEAALHDNPAVKTAICLGHGRFEIVVLIEPTQSIRDENGVVEDVQVAKLITSVWETISAKNPDLDQPGRISSSKAIFIKPPSKAIPRTDKGSVSRQQVYEVFADEIDAAYAAVDGDVQADPVLLKSLRDNTESAIRSMVDKVLPNSDLTAAQDFFESGMDSLQAVRLARQLARALKSEASGVISAEFVYGSPSIQALTQSIQKLLGGCQSGQIPTTAQELAAMKALSSKYIRNLQNGAATGHPKPPHGNFVVLLSGATGSLGSHVLAQLIQNPLVKTIYCTYRSVSTAVAQNGTVTETPLERLKSSISRGNISLDRKGWAKVKLVDNAKFRSPCDLESPDPVLQNLLNCVTHIVHLAWPMDFHRILDSFTAHIDMVENLVHFSRACWRIQSRGRLRPSPVRLLFASSIAAIRHYKKDENASILSSRAAPEEYLQNPEVAASMGYAHAKWVCEQMLQHVHGTLGREVEPIILRIGQISGPEATEGVWKTSEHVPTLLKASAAIGAVPALHGCLSWLPVDRASRSVMDILFHSGPLDPVLHVENPVRQSADGVMTIMANEMGLSFQKVSYEEWLKQAAEAGTIDSLEDFFTNDFQDLALGNVALDTTKARAVSATLRGSSGIDHSLLVQYVRRWKKLGLFDRKQYI